MIAQSLIQRIRREIEAMLPEIVALRHALHREPELALQETKTQAAILQALQGVGLTLWSPLLGTDIIGELPGRSARTVCLRADIDAVPIPENTGLAYASIVPGVMHGCGHDGHAAMLVGAARVLARLRDQLPSTVRFVFQPGEEIVAAGKDLVARGACDGAAAVYALHGWPELPVGCVSACPGPLFAAGSLFTIAITGKGSHGAHPEKGNNPIPIAAQVVERLQQLHRTLNPESRTVVSVCAFQAGANGNVIPETAVLQGTGRYLRADIGDEVEAAIRRIATATAHELGAAVAIDYSRRYDLPVLNTAAGFDTVRRAAQTALPAGHWIEAAMPSMGMEDFAYYLPGREGAMFFLGLGEQSPYVHTPTFDFNDAALPTGILMHCLLALTG